MVLDYLFLLSFRAGKPQLQLSAEQLGSLLPNSNIQLASARLSWVHWCTTSLHVTRAALLGSQQLQFFPRPYESGGPKDESKGSAQHSALIEVSGFVRGL